MPWGSWGGYPARSSGGGVPWLGGVPWPGGYPGWGVPWPEGGTLARGGYPGRGGTLARGVPWPGGGTQLGQHREYLLHGGRYASCVHAGGFSCLFLFLESQLHKKTLILDDRVTDHFHVSCIRLYRCTYLVSDSLKVVRVSDKLRPLWCLESRQRGLARQAWREVEILINCSVYLVAESVLQSDATHAILVSIYRMQSTNIRYVLKTNHSTWGEAEDSANLALNSSSFFLVDQQYYLHFSWNGSTRWMFFLCYKNIISRCVASYITTIW